MASEELLWVTGSQAHSIKVVTSWKWCTTETLLLQTTKMKWYMTCLIFVAT